ncbi:hypothetical protein E4U17_006601 [Claviceps sp. LM77 group G4]|nr:hypothetical protein E4U17_006601 [Claviceps sp. LM77 group G4]
MQREPYEYSERPHNDNIPSDSSFDPQHGLLQLRDPNDARPVRSAASASDSHTVSPRSVSNNRRDADVVSVDANRLDEKLRGLALSNIANAACRQSAAGQRVSEYENALTPPISRQALGFKVTRRIDSSSNAAQLANFPNEILTHVLSHLHPDSHAAVALVSKRFYHLVTTSHAWRMAFMRYFPGPTCLDSRSARSHAHVWAETVPDIVRSEIRYFGRLTLLATWRSEYVLRMRLMRSLARGKPGTSAGGVGLSGCAGKPVKRKNAVLTYNSKLPWQITNIHAVFSNGKKPPRAVQGAGDVGVATMSDPSTGKIEKWGLEDAFSSAQLEEVMPSIVPYGLGEGPVAIPNIMDVSQPYGMIAGEGFPGGRAYFRGTTEACGRYLGGGRGVVDMCSDVPKIPEMADSICSVWIAKSPAVPATTQGMCGMLTGSALGVVTAYALGGDPSGPRSGNGQMTVRWVVSPGVPIISLKVDDQYNMKRRSSSRVWAVALNALGEVFYLTEAPVTTVAAIFDRGSGVDTTRNAWLAGRTAYWHLVESTRRAARSDARDRYAIRGAYTPRSPSNDMKLSRDQLAAEAREIEKFLLYKPSHFRKVCQGWDMQRKLEVDFAADDGQGAGESVFVIDCGLVSEMLCRVRRFTRLLTSTGSSHGSSHGSSPQSLFPPKAVITAARGIVMKPQPSLFGYASVNAEAEGHVSQTQSPRPPPPTSAAQAVPHGFQTLQDWTSAEFELTGIPEMAVITSSCLDCSSPSLLTLGEDPLYTASNGCARDATTADFSTTSSTPSAAKPETAVGEIPGRRARLLAVGTNTGVVIAWNGRDRLRQGSAQPVRVLQTDSPEISCVAASALYLVHGGSDGLVQAWDPLASIMGPIRTINPRSNGRIPRHMVSMNPALRQGNHTAVGAIFLDPDPTVLSGVLSFGVFLRFWSYSSSGYPIGRKRRIRHSDVHGRVASRRLGGTVSGYIAAEAAELRKENEARAREQAHLRKRFGVGALGDLTEEEALLYAQMMSEEAYLQDEQRRASDSAANASVDTSSSSFSDLAAADIPTPEPSVSDMTFSRRMVYEPKIASSATDIEEESEFDQQIQQAIRLSLLEGGTDTDVGQSHRANSTGELDFPIKVMARSRKNKAPGSATTSLRSTQHVSAMTVLHGDGASNSRGPTTEDEDLALALSLSMQEGEASLEGLRTQEDEFPALDMKGAGKGKGVTRW